jgi:hypothetical protein
MRMIITCFARVPQRCTSRLYMHFLLIFQELRPISKTRNQLFDINDWPLTCRRHILPLRGFVARQAETYRVRPA